MRHAHAMIPAAALCVAVAANVAFTQGTAPDQTVRYDGHLLVEATPDSWDELTFLRSLDGRLMSEGFAVGAAADWIISPEAYAHLTDSGIDYDVLDVDIQRLIDAESRRIARSQDQVGAGARGVDWFLDYKNRGQIEAYLDDLMATYPDLISESIVGESIEGETIYEYTITSPVGGAAADKPAVHFNGMIHSREWVSPMTMMYFIDQLLVNYGSDAEITRAMDEMTWYIIPVLNPDGYDYSWTDDRLWRKNRRNNGDGTFGVDLNRNFSVGWGNGQSNTSDTSSDVYYGTSPFSEPEARALRDAILAKPNVKAFIDFHSYSQLILWPLGYDFNVVVPEPDNTNMINLSFAMRDAIFATTGEVYTAQNSTDLYPAGGTTADWGYEEAGVYSWTFELRPASQFEGGFQLPADEILPTARENFAAALTLADAVIDGVSWTFPAGLPTTVNDNVAIDLAFEPRPLFGETLDAGSAEVGYRVDGGPVQTVNASLVTGSTFTASLPPQACGSTVEFFFTVNSNAGETFREPASTQEFFALDVAAQATVATDDMETNTGWTVGQPGDTATTGIWERANPIGTDAQPEDDNTPTGADCWVTGNNSTSLGGDDVDSGATSLVSPAFDLAGASDALVRYARWYSNDEGASPGADVFRVFVSNDDGETWTLLEEVGPGGEQASGGWFTAENALPIAPSGQVRLKFVAEDGGSGSIVEAAIDDLEVIAVETCCVGDLTGDNSVDGADLVALLASFGTSDGSADINGDGSVDGADLVSLLAAFGTSCN